MRIFLFALSALSLLIAAHRFSLAEHTGQNQGALFFLLIGILLLITAALIGGHQDERDLKSQRDTEKEHSKEAGSSAVHASEEQGMKS